MKFFIGAIAALLVTSCSTSAGGVKQFDAPNKGTFSPLKPGSDIYASASPSDNGVNATPVYQQELYAKPNGSVCQLVGQDVIEYSKYQASSSSTSSIDRIISYKLVLDIRNKVRLPKAGKKVVVVECKARVHWQAAYRSDLTMYLLLDGNGNFRVRWDQIHNVKRDK